MLGFLGCLALASIGGGNVYHLFSEFQCRLDRLEQLDHLLLELLVLGLGIRLDLGLQHVLGIWLHIWHAGIGHWRLLGLRGTNLAMAGHGWMGWATGSLPANVLGKTGYTKNETHAHTHTYKCERDSRSAQTVLNLRYRQIVLKPV